MPQKAVILGAGASRGTSYLRAALFPSVLDNDFFELLNRLPQGKYGSAVRDVLRWRKTLPVDCKDSLERSFYMLQTRAYLSEKFTSKKQANPTHDLVIAQYTRCAYALLRHVHLMHVCSFHQEVFKILEKGDAIISFNYDLVAERALRNQAEPLGVKFDWLYGFDGGPTDFDCPRLLRLHGSANWRLNEKNKRIRVRTKQWNELDIPIAPRFTADQCTLLPFWDKRIEQEPWLKIWKSAYLALREIDNLLVWGYSLPNTDIKARQLLALPLDGRPFNLIVIDPSRDTRSRWKKVFPKARYRGFSDITEFLRRRPKAWRL